MSAVTNADVATLLKRIEQGVTDHADAVIVRALVCEMSAFAWDHWPPVWRKVMQISADLPRKSIAVSFCMLPADQQKSLNAEILSVALSRGDYTNRTKAVTA